MKKLLMCSAACALGLAVAGPAKADGIKMDLAGHMLGYVTWVNESVTGTTTDERHFDILRETEIHFTGETTLDNGLTVGVHHEALIDEGESSGLGQDAFLTRESYAYFSGAWGRVNFGKEDGANYLLEVAAPSADTNYDGLRQLINPEGLGVFGLGGALAKGTGIQGSGPGAGDGVRGFANTGGKLDYSDNASGFSNKITYLTPVWSGFQAGASYTPSMGTPGLLSLGGTPGANEASTAFGVPVKDVPSNYGDAWEGALRYEGKWQEIGVTAGGGYTHVQYTTVDATDQNDAFHQWNLGAEINWQQFGLGVVYTTDNGGLQHDGQNRTWVAGIDYTTGPFKIGGSYLNNHEGLGDTTETSGISNGQLDTQRWAPGVVYTYGPGMTFRGSVGWVHTTFPDEGGNVGDAGVHANSTDVLLGTQINF